MENALKTQQDQTFNFKNWVKFLNELLNKKKVQYDRHWVNSVSEEFDKNFHDTINTIREEIESQLIKLEEKEGLISGYIISIDKIFVNINDHNSNFSLERVRSSFDNLGLKDADEKFDYLEELSDSVANSYDKHFRRLLSNYNHEAKLYFSEKMKREILNVIKTPKIICDLKTSFGEAIMSSSDSDSLVNHNTQTAPDLSGLRWMTFKFKPLKKEESKELQSSITEVLKHLKLDDFVDNDTSLSLFRAVFSGNEDINYIQQKVRWIGTNAELHYFVDLIYPLMKNPSDEIWKVTYNCFKTKKEKEFKLESLRQAKVEEIKYNKKKLLDNCAEYLFSNF